MQPFPKTGILSKNFDKSVKYLKKHFGQSSDGVYSYIVRSIAVGDQFEQWGTAPNFQGGCITLCTCKHQMRSRLPTKEWRGKWLAGFTSRAHGGDHWLFYLAKIESAYESHAKLWNLLPNSVRQAKSSRCFQLGDLHEPKGNLIDTNQFDPADYHTPVSGHSHRRNACDNGWIIDIDYRRKKNLKKKPQRRSALLVCEPRLSFLWKSPKIRLKENHVRDYQRWETLDDFLAALK